MPVVLIIEKGGSIKELKVASYSEEELYKKAGFKSKEGFNKHTTWSVAIDETHYEIALYGKDNGNAGRENKYDLPPPLDNTLFFGNIVLVNKDGSADLRKEEWKKVYEHLFGGFEDIEESEEDDESEEDLEGLELTKDGYVKDDFIVESDEDEEEIEESEESEESEEEIKPKRKSRKPTKPSTIKKETKNAKKTKKTADESEEETVTKELEPEEYLTR
jgi:hypothetical protein